MFCMKCGKEISEGQVFCSECLAVMDRHPVKPGTPVQLPNRSVTAPVKKVSRRKKEVPVEKQLQRQKKLTAWLSGLLAACLLIIGFLGAVVWEDHAPDPTPEHTIGQNYNTKDTGDSGQ